VLKTAVETAAAVPVDDGLEDLMKVFDKAVEGDNSTTPTIRKAIAKNPKLADAFGGNLAKVVLLHSWFRSRASLIAEILALRQQLAVLHRTTPKPRLRSGTEPSG